MSQIERKWSLMEVAALVRQSLSVGLRVRIGAWHDGWYVQVNGHRVLTQLTIADLHYFAMRVYA